MSSDIQGDPGSDIPALRPIDIFPWNDNFSVGLPEVDLQHQKLVQLLNKLASHIAFNSSISSLNEILDELTDYTVYHFHTEEALWREYLPDDAIEMQHRELHGGFVETIRRIKREQESRLQDNVIEEILSFLAKWLASHILEEDRYLGYVVLAMRSGMSLSLAKTRATEQMSGGTRVLIDIILAIYSTLSTNTLNLMRKLGELKNAEVRYREIFQTTLDAINITRAGDGRYMEVNQAFTDITGYERDEVIGHTGEELHLWHDPGDRLALIAEVHEKGRIYNHEIQFKKKGGEVLWGQISSAKVTLDGEPCFLSITRDITERKRTEELLVNNENKYRTIFEHANDAIFIMRDDSIIDCNRRAVDVFGCKREDLIGSTPVSFSPGKQPDGSDSSVKALEYIQAAYRGDPQVFEWTHARLDGAPFDAEVSLNVFDIHEGHCLLAIVRNVTERKRAEEKIEHLAFYDYLTDLPNRRLLVDRLKQAIASSARSGQYGAILLIDMDNFKNLNESLGHDLGDMLLEQVAARLVSSVRDGDTVARLGGDEFVVLLEDMGARAMEAGAQVEMLGEKILNALCQPYALNRHVVHSASSIGITLFHLRNQESDDLLKQADIAMYQAKKAGRNTLRFFDPLMQKSINARAVMESELHVALENQQFRLFYQIQVDDRHQPLGAEALIRWMHPRRGVVAPGEFISLAEDSGLILPIGRWVIDAACAQLVLWGKSAVTRNLVLSVNISAKQFHQPGFANQVRELVQRHGIDTSLLKFELTESMLLDDMDATISTMNELNAIGIRISLDDFGTGYSSLQYLKRLPINQLKIDQSFVRDISIDGNDKAIVQTIIAMAHSLKLSVIAEGVETEEQKTLLLGSGCNFFQGYLFSRPLPIEQFESLLVDA